ncbi:metal ABC transporter permease [bacterium]|nr:metal ABC transporter permease [bacterium]MBU1881165.1 metal ABC transporter permease [bacterium]
MIDFVQALFNPDLPFLRYALFAGLLSSLAFGLVGSFVVAKRISYIAGAISHSVLGGIGLGLYLSLVVGWSWFQPLLGAMLAALLAALIIGWVSLRGSEREDTIIGAIWAVGMAVGLIFIAKTPGYIDPMSYLFGNILLISRADLWLIVLLDAVIIAVVLLFFDKLLAICFDEEYARLRGINVEFYYLMLLFLTALTVVLMVRIVGIVMVIALLTLPAGIAGIFVQRLRQMMILATLLCSFFVTVGLALSYSLDWPTGPTIIIFAGIVYLAALAGQKLIRK